MFIFLVSIFFLESIWIEFCIVCLSFEFILLVNGMFFVFNEGKIDVWYFVRYFVMVFVILDWVCLFLLSNFFILRNFLLIEL